MQSCRDGSAFWPRAGLWGASYRIFFALAAIWAALTVPLWAWTGQPVAGAHWHRHEMLFGLGSAALAGYLLTAWSQWSGRAPVSGWPLAGLAVLWIGARVAALSAASGVGPPLLLAAACGAPFWTISLILGQAMRQAPGPGRRPLAPALFCLLAGGVAARDAGNLHDAMPGTPEAAMLLFTLLLAAMGGRMVPAFLRAAAVRSAPVPPPQRADATIAALAALALAAGAAASEAREIAAGAAGLAGLMLALAMRGWPLKGASTDALAAMALVAFSWLPVGLILWAAAVAGLLPLAPGDALHTLAPGAMGGLMIAIMARASARRGDAGLRVRLPALAGFACVMVAVPLRLAGLTDAAALAWSAGWLGVLAAHLPACFGPVPRPVFSARRSVPTILPH